MPFCNLFMGRPSYMGLLNSNMLPEFFDRAKGVDMATKFTHQKNKNAQISLLYAI